MSASADMKYWRAAYEELVRQTGRDLNDGLGIDPRRKDWLPPLAAAPSPAGGRDEFAGLAEMIAATTASPEYRALIEVERVTAGTKERPIGTPEWCTEAIFLIEQQAMSLAALMVDAYIAGASARVIPAPAVAPSGGA